MIVSRINYYTGYILSNMPRVLTQIDRDKDSKTYGSCDRNFWHLKIRDFSSAILQQTSLTLALIYKLDFPGNIYYRNENVKQWAVAALKYLTQIQLKDGSFNEYYPNEHGYPPTAFVLFAGCKTYQELDLQDGEILQTLGKAAYWLARHRETKAYNQEWAAIAGIHLYSSISGDKNICLLLDTKVADILKVQSQEGWFPEQGGADIGYSSVALDMLGEYYLLSDDQRVEKPLYNLVDFLKYFVHPDRTAGGEYGSRNTVYFMPNGMETVVQLHCSKSSTAAAVIEKLYGYHSNDCSKNFMDAVDERYLAHYVMHSYLRALQKAKPFTGEITLLPCEKEHEKIFFESGLITKCLKNYYFVINAKKGGVLKVFVDGKEWGWDCGYRIPIRKGKTAATNWLDDSYIVEWAENRCIIKGKFNVVAQKVQNPLYHAGLRILAMMAGSKVNKMIKKLTIFSDKHNNVKFQRTIEWKNDVISISDDISSPTKIVLEEASNISLRLVASGKFFSMSDLHGSTPWQCEFAGNIRLDKKFDIANHIIVNR